MNKGKETTPSILPPKSLATAFGIDLTRCAGSWSEMPRMVRPGDDWTPTGICRDLAAVKRDLEDLCTKLDKGRKHGKDESAAPSAARRLDTRKDIARALKDIAAHVVTIRDSALECYAEFNHAQLFRRADPEVNGYGILLQATPEPPEWASKDRLAADRKRKQLTAASAPRAKRKKTRHGEPAAEVLAPSPPPPPPPMLSLESVLGERIPLRPIVK